MSRCIRTSNSINMDNLACVAGVNGEGVRERKMSRLLPRSLIFPLLSRSPHPLPIYACFTGSDNLAHIKRKHERYNLNQVNFFESKYLAVETNLNSVKCKRIVVQRKSLIRTFNWCSIFRKVDVPYEVITQMYR